jgi:predicted solute-binding protein
MRTGTPACSRWAVRSGLPARAKAELALSIRSALDLALDDLEDVAQAQAERSKLPQAPVQAYLGGIRYRLGANELAGAAEFERRLALLP